MTWQFSSQVARAPGAPSRAATPGPTASATAARSSKADRASPKAVSSRAAVFGPMPRTPGRLSDGSPRSAAKSRYCSGRTPNSVTSRSAVSTGDASTPPLMIRSTRVWASMRPNASRSEVTTTVVAPTAGACRATEASTSSASSPVGTTTATPSSRSTSAATASWSTSVSSLAPRWAL